LHRSTLNFRIQISGTYLIFFLPSSQYLSMNLSFLFYYPFPVAPLIYPLRPDWECKCKPFFFPKQPSGKNSLQKKTN